MKRSGKDRCAMGGISLFDPSTVFIKERDVLRKPAVRAWANFGEDIGEIPRSNPVEIKVKPLTDSRF
jgi:hypothetical protein